ncbi:Putative nitroreductase [Aspergillus tubingensis]
MRLHLLGLIGICLAGLALLVFTENIITSNLFAATTHTNIMAVPRVLARRVFHSSSSLFGLRGNNLAAVNTPSPLVTTTTASAASAVRSFSSIGSVKMPSQMPSSGALVDLAKGRHSIYKLGKNSPVPDEKIEELVNQAILNVPSAFNTQSTRLVVLLHKEHERLWDITMDLFQARVKEGTLPEEMWKNQTQPKLQGFKNGLGTILFYEDPAHIEPFKEKFPTYKDQFEPWAHHTNAMHQYFLWIGLESLGFGANLQHYNPLIDAPVAKQWDIPTDWRLISQLVFGSPEVEGQEKPKKPVEERVKVYGKL